MKVILISVCVISLIAALYLVNQEKGSEVNTVESRPTSSKPERLTIEKVEASSSEEIIKEISDSIELRGEDTDLEALKKLSESEQKAFLEKEYGFTFEASSPVSMLFNSLKLSFSAYRKSVGELPIGDNKSIALQLLGANSRSQKFINEKGDHLNADGELIDPWGTPLKFKLLNTSEGQSLEIRSAGANRQFGDDDDVLNLVKSSTSTKRKS